MPRYNYGKKFKKNGRTVQYRYTNGRKSTKKLVNVKSRRSNSSRRRYKSRRGRQW